MSADATYDVLYDRKHLNDAARAGYGPAGAPFDPSPSSHGHITDVLVSELLKTRAARPPDLESENEFLQGLAQHLLTDPEHILERSMRGATRLCGAESAGVSLLEADGPYNEVFQWVALGGAFEGQEGWRTPRFVSPCGLAFQSQAPQLFSYPARYYTCLRGAVPEIVEMLVLPLPDGAGTIWIVAHDEATRFDGEHVRILTGLATFMATSLRLLRLRQKTERLLDETERDLAARSIEAASRPRVPALVSSGCARCSVPPSLRADPVERGSADVGMLDPEKSTGDLVAKAGGLGEAEQHQGTSPVTRRTEMNEVRLAFRALIEQVRLVLRDGRRLIRRLITVCDTFRGSSEHITNNPAPLASVPLVVMRSTTEREQIELNHLVQSLSAEGHQVTRRGPQWVVYTEITDRRTSGIGRRRNTVEEQRR